MVSSSAGLFRVSKYDLILVSKMLVIFGTNNFGHTDLFRVILVCSEFKY